MEEPVEDDDLREDGEEGMDSSSVDGGGNEACDEDVEDSVGLRVAADICTG